jgi:hypothetical protein
VTFLDSGKIRIKYSNSASNTLSLRIVETYMEAEVLRDSTFSRFLLKQLCNPDTVPGAAAINKAYSYENVPVVLRRFLVYCTLRHVQGDVGWFRKNADKYAAGFVQDLGDDALVERRGKLVTDAEVKRVSREQL